MSKSNNINTLTENPLAEAPQREKSGSDTYRKYNYQYHWALCRIIEEHEQGNEYALFMEYHDDVVISDSLSSQIANFEFNQVKETISTYSASSLTAKSGKNSVLGKLLLDSCAKPFCEKIKSINLVSSGGFNLKLKDPSLNLDVITVGHVDDTEITAIKEKLALEIGDIALPEHLAFILPDLQPKDFSHSVKGRIAELIDKMSPNNYYNTVSIYRCLIEDLARKGENTFDYQNWEEALKKKSVTSEQVTWSTRFRQPS